MNAIHTLLRQAIDYAGLFPPAGLGMGAAVENYVAYHEGPDAWALGRFIVPATRLREFADQAAAIPSGPGWPWQLSVLVGPDWEADLGRLREFQRQPSVRAMTNVAAVELKAEEVHAIEKALGMVPRELEVYFEVPGELDSADLMASIGAGGARAKLRTGGVTPDAFPSAANLDRFIRACLRAEVPFKATAGLHHAVRGEYRLTYEEHSLTGTMFGFLNLFLATALARAGASANETRGILVESSPDAFRLEDSVLRWRDHRLGMEQLARAREYITSFGSCSFTEPITELHALQSNVQQA